MLKQALKTAGRKRAYDYSSCNIIRHSSSTAAAAQATVVSSSVSPPRPPPPSSSSSSLLSGEQRDSQLKPQPFIPKPHSRAWQIELLERAADSSTSTTIHFTTGDGAESQHLTVPNLFLRDASTHPSHVHPSSRQKLFRSTDVPLEGSVVGYGVHEMAGEDHLVMEWTTAVEGVDSKMAKLSVTPLSTIVELLSSKRGRSQAMTVPGTTSWTGQELRARLKRAAYADYARDDRALLQTLDSLLKDGIGFIEGVPTEEKTGHNTELRRLVERIASVRTTWYGDLFDVRAEQGSKNIAYTNLNLDLHMDLTHFESPPRYQFLQSLQNTGVTGGASYFVDSYAVAEQIRAADPDAFDTLTREPLLFSYQSDTHHTRFVRPVIELEPGSDTRIHAINYSPPFQGPLPVEPSDGEAARLARLHAALRMFADKCDDPANRYEVQLEPGDCVVFDNRRVLHARTAFEWTPDEVGGEEKGRWLKGAYCDGDEVRSKWRVVKQRRPPTAIQLKASDVSDMAEFIAKRNAAAAAAASTETAGGTGKEDGDLVMQERREREKKEKLRQKQRVGA